MSDREVKIDLRNVSFYYHLSRKGLKIDWKNGKFYANNIYRALSNINLELEKGDVVGIIGPNGAGKSTLLKVLAGLIEPDEGKVDIQGRVFPYVSMSGGIMPHATCLQNIKLRGYLMNLNKEKMKEYTNNVIASADLGVFLHSPFKALSTGMRSKFAISLLGYADPEILILDEWIGTTDKAFINNDNGPFKKIMKEISLMVFATHNDKIIQENCNKVILMDKGQVLYCGQVNEGMEFYRSK